MNVSNINSCPVCTGTVVVSQRLSNLSDVKCATCGRFLITLDAIEEMGGLRVEERADRLHAAIAASMEAKEDVPVVFAKVI
jgi:hypothetical protein